MAKNLNYVRGVVDNEGFDYAFRCYSDFSLVKDEEFHKLRLAYIAAADALSAYAGLDREDEEDYDEEDD
jgi:hypothetical protein